MNEYEKIVKEKGYVMKLTWPIFIELLLQMLVGNVDQIMVGRYSQMSVGAIGNANQIMNLLIISFSVICMATTILVSLYVGSGDKKRLPQIYTVSLFVNLVFSLIIGLILLAFTSQILTWMQVPEDLMAETQAYLKIIGGFTFLQSIYLTFGAILRSNAFMKETMIISIIVNAVNILGNLVLINGYFGIEAMGVAGAAVSSNISRFFGIIFIYIVFRKKIGAKIRGSHLKPFPVDIFKKLMGIGIPSGGESLSYNLSQIFIQKIVNIFGTAVIATRVYANMFAMLSYMFASAIAQASQIIVGYMMGARDIENTNKRVWATLKIAMLISFIVSLLLYLFCEPIFGLFTNKEEVIVLGKTIMFIEIFLELGRAVNMVLVRALQAAGDIKFPIVMCVIHAWLLGVVLGYVLGVVMGYGLVGVWIAMALDECVRGIIFIVRWKNGAWKTRNLIGG